MNENACRKLEEARDRAWRDWETAHAAEQATILPPVTEALGIETPPPSGTFRQGMLAAIDKARESKDKALREFTEISVKLNDCYREHNVPPDQRAPWPLPQS